jgi:hypothetical protein
MGDRSLTLFEVHLHDGLSFSATNTAPAIGSDDGDEEDDAVGTDIEIEDTEADTGSERTESAGPGAGLAVLVGLVLVAGLAVAARKLMGDDDLEQLEELDDLAAEA